MEAKDKLREITKELTEEFTSALASAGEKLGLGESSEAIARQAVLGSAELVRQSGIHPVELADRVCSPGGTTIEGLLSLKKDGFEGVITEIAEEKMQK